MDCGVPFCHNGCPLGNLIPDWNDLVYRDRSSDAIAQLHAPTTSPSSPGRLCPAPCEAACVLEIREGDAVTIKQIENSIINRAFEEGWVAPEPPPLADRPAGRRRRIGPRRHRRRAAAAPRRPRRSCSSSATSHRRARSASACPTSRSKRRSSSGASSSSLAEGVELRCGVDVGVDLERARSCARTSTPWFSRPARASRATSPSRARARRRALRDGLPLPAQPLGRARARTRADRREPPVAAGITAKDRTSS